MIRKISYERDYSKIFDEDLSEKRFIKPMILGDLVYSKIMQIQDFMKFVHINLLQLRLIELANNVLICYNNTFFLIKNRRPILDERGNIDITATYNDILSRQYYVVTNKELPNIIDDLLQHPEIIIKDFVIKVN